MEEGNHWLGKKDGGWDLREQQGNRGKWKQEVPETRSRKEACRETRNGWASSLGMSKVQERGLTIVWDEMQHRHRVGKSRRYELEGL